MRQLKVFVDDFITAYSQNRDFLKSHGSLNSFESFIGSIMVP